MSSRDNLANPRQSFNESRRVERDARRSGQEYQSLRRGAHRVITADGDPLAALGHIGARSGLLLRVGSEWRTVQEHIDARIATAFEYPDARLAALEASMNNFGPRLGAAEGELAGVPGKIAQSHEYPNARITANEEWRNANGPTINTHGVQIGQIFGRLSAAEADIAALESSRATKSLLNQVIDKLNALDDFVESQHPTKISVPPIVKG